MAQPAEVQVVFSTEPMDVGLLEPVPLDQRTPCGSTVETDPVRRTDPYILPVPDSPGTPEVAMNWGKALVWLMAIESACAACGYWYAGDKNKACYWAFACGINSTFLF